MRIKKYFFAVALMALSLPSIVVAQDEYDDIYYNPKSKKEAKKDNKKSESYYISDFSSMDVDEYNRRGQYYESPVDTIGVKAENGEDFVYTQQIQKYYNPTIVVDNMNVVKDIIDNSYGNVDIVFNNGAPMFTSIYTGIYGWAPVYYDWYYSPAWRWHYAWGPSWTWTVGPTWGWGPSWSWGPSWGYYPSWSWAWGYGPGYGYYPHYHHHSRPYYADYRPGGHRPVRPSAGWANNTRPGGNYNGHNTGSHSATGRPGYYGSNAKPNNGSNNRTYSGNRRGYNDPTINSNSTTVRNNSASNNRVSSSSTGNVRSNNNKTVGTNRVQSSSVTNHNSQSTVSKGNRNNYNSGANGYSGGSNSYNRSGSTSTSRSSYSNSSSNRSSFNSGGSSSRGGSSAGRSSGGGGSRGGNRR